MPLFVTKRQLAQYLNLSTDTLKRYRLQGEWLEGIHWVRINSRCVRYNLELIKDWLHNRNHPTAHRRAIKTYQKSSFSYPKKV
jgi:hypothetical protein